MEVKNYGNDGIVLFTRWFLRVIFVSSTLACVDIPDVPGYQNNMIGVGGLFVLDMVLCICYSDVNA